MGAKKKTAGLAMLLLASSSTLAMAQEASLTEIIVTAQKRAERIIDVPMSIQALSGRDLAQKGINSIQDLSFAVPGMVLREDGPGTQQIWMRGMGNLSGSEALTAVYLDEVPVTLNAARNLDTRMLDLDRVEVLKGPQGTLYGQGAVAGTVRFVTKAPQLDRFSGSLEGELAAIEDGDLRQHITAVANLPVVKDVFAVRIAATAEHGGGWIDQPQAHLKDANNQDLVHVRLKGLWRPTDKLEIAFTGIVHQNESELGLNYEEPDRTITVAVDRARKLMGRVNKYYLGNLTAKYDFDFATLLSATSVIHQRHRYPASYIAGPQTVYGVQLEGTDKRWENSRQFTEELRLSSNGDGPFKWTVGGFYRNAKTDLYVLYDTLYAGVLYDNPPYISNATSESYSLFGDVSYDVTDRIELGAGVRYFNDKGGLFDGVRTQAATFRSTDPRFYGKYKIAKDWNVYFNVAKGFRSGGFNQFGLPAYGPEKVWNYEVGTKATILNGAVDVNFAAYRSEYTNMLRRGLVLVGTAFQDLTSNIGQTRVDGVEASATWRATRQLTLSATATFIDSKVVAVDVATAANRPGDPVDYVPKWALTGSANYEFDWAPTVPGFARLDVSYRDKVHYTDRFIYQPQYAVQSSQNVTLVDARAGAKFNDLSVEVFVQNLLNENRWVDPFINFHQANRSRPRTFGVKLGYEF